MRFTAFEVIARTAIRAARVSLLIRRQIDLRVAAPKRHFLDRTKKAFARFNFNYFGIDGCAHAGLKVNNFSPCSLAEQGDGLGAESTQA